MTPRTPSELACQELVQLVTDYLESVLPAAERDRFERHIASCRGCDAYLRQMRELVRVAGRIPTAFVPPDPPPELLRAFGAWKAERV
ncbi:MAG TPA: zf-HC2 domain-containing protein [Myxococcales bacterium]